MRNKETANVEIIALLSCYIVHADIGHPANTISLLYL